MDEPQLLASQCPALLGLRFKLAVGEFIVGRSPEHEWVVKHLSVSRLHARVTVGADCVSVTDLRSSNGTFVNDDRIETCRIRSGDVVRFGAVAFLLGSNSTESAGADSLFDSDKPVTRAVVSTTALTLPALTGQERRVLKLLLVPGPEKKIARQLGMKDDTCHGYVQAIFRKFGAHSRVDLMVAVQRIIGWVESNALSHRNWQVATGCVWPFVVWT